ncbi:MAG: family 20 glycosylhydrolase, partial [Clostridiales bacterium]|nr:family 20 glycosylhydrolase [Clostridiales bacterium]
MRIRLLNGESALAQGITELIRRLNLEKKAGDLTVKAVLRGEDGYTFSRADGSSYKICYHARHEFFMALARIISGESRGTAARRLDAGFLLDCAKNAVPNADTLKRTVVNLALCGYSQLYLYVEDCIAVPGEERLGYMRGRFTADEIREIDAYCRLFGIALIPCIQTLGHYAGLFYSHVAQYLPIYEYEDTILAENEPTYQFLTHIIQWVSGCFSSGRIHICLNDAKQTGLGEYLKKNKYKPRASILKTHIDRVCAICEAYGLAPVMWTDMLVEDDTLDPQGLKNLIADLPKNLTFMCYDDYKKSEFLYEKLLKSNIKAFETPIFCCNINNWLGFAPLNYLTDTRLVPALDACVKLGIDRVVFTAWAEAGGESAQLSVLPSLLRLSDEIYAFDGGRRTDRLAKLLTGYTPDELMCLDLPNTVPGCDRARPANPAKYLLYEDPILSHYLINADETYRQYYLSRAETLRALSRRKSPYAYLFVTLYRLCAALADKCLLSAEIEGCYRAKNAAGLKEIAA